MRKITNKQITKGGRPAIKEDKKMTKRINFRVDEATYKDIQAKVEKARFCISEILRRALKNADISEEKYRICLKNIKKFGPGNLAKLVAVSATVTAPLSPEDNKELNSLYRFARDVNALVKRGNASIQDTNERIDYIKELNALKARFSAIKNYFNDKVSWD